ncbi:MAG: hypothetical protein HYU29_04655 [Chloroflexi bacterium]|nr:hypothetical protein [Chloroflexota bacterium]
MGYRQLNHQQVERTRDYLRGRYEEALGYAVQYGKGWEEASKLFTALQEYERALFRREAPVVARAA